MWFKNHIARNILFITGFLFIGFWVVLAFKSQDATGGNSLADASVVTVERRDFALTITERGVVKPAKVTPVKSGLQGNQAKLIWVLNEGTQVNKGLLIARFDTKPFMDLMQKAEQELVDAKAQYESALKGLELQKELGEAKIAEAQRKLEIENIKANDLKNGSGPLKRKQREKKLRETIRNADVAKQAYEDLKILLDKGHISLREYQKAENAYYSAVDAREFAEADLDNFGAYEWPRIIREAELITNAAMQELARVKRTNEIEEQQQRSKVEKFRRMVVAKEKDLQKAQNEVARCDIRAPAEGILLYVELPQGEKKRKVQLGDSIWEGQTFLEIPDTHDLVVEIEIREIDVSKLTLGKTARIYLDAYPGKSFAGTIVGIDALAQQDSNNPNIRRFNTTVKIEGVTEEVHVGMSASVDIRYEKLEDVLTVPADAVAYRNNEAFVQMLTGGSVRETPVKVGKTGVEWMQIVEGLSENDQVISRTY